MKPMGFPIRRKGSEFRKIKSVDLAKSPRFGLHRGEGSKIVAIYILIIASTGILIFASMLLSRLSPVISGLGIVAYVLGLRHGVDIDHIAAIDNTTRKLLQQGKKSSTVGGWFSLGHSTVVIAFVTLLVLLTRSLYSEMPVIQSLGSIIGLVTSGTFLVAIGLINLVVVIGIYRVFRRVKDRDMSDLRLEDFMGKTGILNRLFRKLFDFVKEPWHIYPIGILFGLGFDTATEIGLIAISIAVGVSSSISIWQIMILPLLFTCGMVLTDTTDGVAMTFAYGWAFLNPLKKVFYNLTISVMSVFVALAIGGIEILQIVGLQLNLNSPFWNWVEGLNFETMGVIIIGVFVLIWFLGYSLWKIKGYDKISTGLDMQSSDSKK